jgi:uncharacterized membrane protein
MTVAPVPALGGSGKPHGRLARWAVQLSAVSGVAFVAAVAVVVIAYAIGEEGAVEDTTLGVVLFLIPAAAVLGSLAAFVMAIVAAVKRERWALLWLPLSVLPAIIVFVSLGEAFLWE